MEKQLQGAMQNSLTPQMSKKPQIGSHSHNQSEQAVTPMSGKFEEGKLNYLNLNIVLLSNEFFFFFFLFVNRNWVYQLQIKYIF